MSNLLFFDSTLRDGSHAIAHQLTEEQIRVYCRQIDGAGLYTVIVGHGPNGDSAVRCAYLASNTVLSGFTLSNGATRLLGFIVPDTGGGGVSGGCLSNCVLIGNTAQWGGVPATVG